MADTGERDVRDRLAEALLLATGSMLSRMRPWSKTPPFVQSAWHMEADTLLAALPTVGLRIGRVEE